METINIDLKAKALEIASRFKQRLGLLKPSPAELAIVEESSQTLARAAVYGAFDADEEQKKLWKVRRDLALSALENLGVAEGIRAARILQETVAEVLLEAIHVAIALAPAVV
jgi:hypothetical protein